MNVTSTKTVDFPKFRWGIHAGEVRELPEDEAAAKAIMEHSAISETDKPVSESQEPGPEAEVDEEESEESEEESEKESEE